MKLRLFGLRSGTRHHTQFFATKPEAKAERDRLNSKDSSANWVVTPGPDHWRSK